MKTSRLRPWLARVLRAFTYRALPLSPLVLLAFASLSGLWLTGCATRGPYAYDAGSHASKQNAAPASRAAKVESGIVAESSPAYSPAPARNERPGLGTKWGEDRRSPVSYSNFHRGNASRPWATGKLFYNDAAGAAAMANHTGFTWRASGPVSVGRLVTIGLKDSRGRYLKSYEAGGNRYFVGDAGDRYSIYLHNQSPARLELVVSVDGLDVMDGKSASYGKRGYLVPSHGSLEIDGFRQSAREVAAFRFSSVRDSYANRKHGDSRNVGVIGLAIFTEHGKNPWHAPDVARRQNANPFPEAAFATPPQ